MSDLSTIIREESLTEQFYQELHSFEFEAAAETIKDLKEMYVPTARFEKDLKDAQADDYSTSETGHEN